MKLKYLLFIAIISISFFFIDNVSALSYVEDVGKNRYYIAHKWVGNSSSNGNDCYYLGWYNKNYDITIKDYTISSATDITYYKVCDYSKFIEFLDTGNTSLVDTTTTNKKEMSLNTDSSHMMFTNFDLYMNGELYFKSIEYKGTNYNHLIQFVGGYNWSFEKYYGAYIDEDKEELYLYGSSNWNSPTQTFDLNEYPYWIGWETDYAQICYSKEPFYYDTTDNNYKTGGTFKCGQSNLNFSNKTSYNYSNTDEFVTNTDIYTQDGVLYKKSTLYNMSIPKIKITKEDESSIVVDGKEEILNITLNIDYGHVDNDNYIYQYKYGSSSIWTTTTITIGNSISLVFQHNDTLYVQVLDKNNEYKPVSTATYTVNSITNNSSSDGRVKIFFQKITKEFDSELYNQCTISQGKISYRACETISISFDTINYKKYIYEMSLDGGNTWVDVSTRIYNNFFLERLFENKTIYIRVLNRSDSSYNSGATYKEATIESTDELGQNVLFSSSYYTQSPDIDVTALFINYDPNSYNYYYSFTSNKDSFVDITDLIDCTNNLCTYKLRVYVKGIVYVKIEDKAGNIVYTATHTVDYYKWMNNNNPFDNEDFFDTFFNSFDYFLNPIKEIFNTISVFFDSLPIEIKYTFYVAFVIMIILFLIKFIL